MNTKKSKWFITATVLAFIAVLLSGTVLFLKFAGGTGEGTPSIAQEKPMDKVPVEVQEPETEENQEPETPLEENTEIEQPAQVEEPSGEKLALYYVPQPNMILTYYHEYTSGEKGEEREITANLDPGILVSKAIMLPEDSEPLLIYHFVEGLEGIYLIQNDNPEDHMLWLPNNPKVGDVWKDPYNEFKIMEMGVSIEAGGKNFDNCIMRKNTNLLADFINISYIAPGYGEVYSVYQGGSFEFELIAEEADVFELGQDVMNGKIEFLEGILSYREK